MAKDYYEVLGIAQDADAVAIKSAYRKLALETHPDRGGHEERFKEVSTAYTALSDPESRALYDRARGTGTVDQFFSSDGKIIVDPAKFKEAVLYNLDFSKGNVENLKGIVGHWSHDSRIFIDDPEIAAALENAVGSLSEAAKVNEMFAKMREYLLSLRVSGHLGEGKPKAELKPGSLTERMRGWLSFRKR